MRAEHSREWRVANSSSCSPYSLFTRYSPRSVRLGALRDRTHRHLAAHQIERIGELEVFVLLAGCGVNDRRVRLLERHFAGQMTGKIGFARTRDLRRFVLVALGN